MLPPKTPIPFEAPSFPATVKTRDGLALVTAHWPTTQPAKGVVCFVHGLGEHARRYAHVADVFNQSDWAAVSYDQRGHGQSPGSRGGVRVQDDLLHDLAHVIDATRRAYPHQRLMLLGHSMGGLVVSRFVSALATPSENAPWQRPVELCVLSTPALDLGMSPLQKGLLATIGRLTPDLAVGNGLKPEWVCSDAAVVKAYVNDPLVHDRITGRLTQFMVDSIEVVHQRAAHWTVPTLLQYPDADRCIRPAGSIRFANEVPTQLLTTIAYKGMSHEIFNEPEKARVLSDLQAWLAGQ